MRLALGNQLERERAEMAIDLELRSKGISGSDVPAIIGMDARMDAHDVYLSKLGLVEREPPTARMKWGKRLERVIAEAYGEETNQAVSWHDMTLSHPERTWQMGSPDAFVVNAGSAGFERLGILDAKNVSFDQQYLWGDGTSEVPDRIAIQMQWYCSLCELPWADVAALFGGSNLKIYRILRDPDVEAMLLEAAEKFWKRVQERQPPDIGATAGAKAYLRQRFPKHVSALRPATNEEVELLEELRGVRAKFDRIEEHKETLQNRVKLAIAESEGLRLPDGDKVTYRLSKSTIGVDWHRIARILCDDELQMQALIAENQVVTKQGSRRLVVPRSWGESEE